MSRENLNDLASFVVIAREKSFTRAAAQLGVSQSALSHTMRALEERLGVRLLVRTTRSVALTDIGVELLDTLEPRLDEITDKINIITGMRDKPAGLIRISSADFIIKQIIWSKLTHFLHQYPDIKVELVDEYALTDIVTNRFDAGTRLGEQLQEGMISVRLSPNQRFVVAGSPDYFAKFGMPEVPKDLLQHQCINVRLPTQGGLYVWEFEKDGQQTNIRVDGQLIFNRIYHTRQAALDGLGLCYIPWDMAEPFVAKGQLLTTLDDWIPETEGYYLFYPSRRQHSKAFKLLIDALRYHG